MPSKLNSREKGKRGEREAAAFIREHGFEARRGCQFKGGEDSEDVTHSIPGVHLEVKRQEKLQLWAWIAQAQAEAKEGNVPVVMFKRNRGEWQVCLPAEDFLRLVKP